MESREGARGAAQCAAETTRWKEMTALARCIASLSALLLVAASVGHHARAQDAASRTKAHVMALASGASDGRLTGSEDERRAAEYIVAQLRRIGAVPLPGRTDYRLPFEFSAGARDGGSSLAVAPTRPGARADTFVSRVDVEALSLSDNGTVSGPVVFAGHGIAVPESQGYAYDSYASLDVKDKIVLVLRYFPESADAKAKAILARYSDLRFKALAARQRGARGLLVVTEIGRPH